MAPTLGSASTSSDSGRRSARGPSTWTRQRPLTRSRWRPPAATASGRAPSSGCSSASSRTRVRPRRASSRPTPASSYARRRSPRHSSGAGGRSPRIGGSYQRATSGFATDAIPNGGSTALRGRRSAARRSLGCTQQGGALELIGDRYYRDDFYNKIQKESYRQVLRIMADRLDGWVRKPEIRKAFRGRDSTLDNAIKALRDRNILSKEGERAVYRLQHKGFAYWIKIYTADPKELQHTLEQAARSPEHPGAS